MSRLSLVPRDESAIRAAVDDFLLAKRADLRSPYTLDLYARCLTPFLAHLQTEGLTDPAQVKAAHVRAYVADRAKRNAPGTVAIHARVIRALSGGCSRPPCSTGLEETRPRCGRRSTSTRRRGMVEEPDWALDAIALTEE